MVGIMNVAFGYIHSCPKMPRSLFLVHILFILALVGENMSVIKSYLLSDILCYEQTTHALFCSFTVFILFVYSNGVSVELWIISVIKQK